MARRPTSCRRPILQANETSIAADPRLSPPPHPPPPPPPPPPPTPPPPHPPTDLEYGSLINLSGSQTLQCTLFIIPSGNGRGFVSEAPGTTDLKNLLIRATALPWTGPLSSVRITLPDPPLTVNQQSPSSKLWPRMPGG